MKNSHIPSPCYVIDIKRLKNNLEKIKRVQDETGVNIILALKAFAGYPLFPLISEYVKGATASSVSEAELVFQEFEQKAHVCAPVVTKQDIEHYNRTADHLVFNSFQQFDTYKNLLNPEISCGIRVNPEYSEVKVDLYNPATESSRLGVMISEMPEELPKGVEGIHFHTLCENNSYTLERVLEKFTSNFDKYLKQVTWVNFGGGHLITEKDYDIPHLINLLKQFKVKYPHLTVYMEPGSAHTWQTGFLKTTVEDVIRREGADIAMLNVSFTGHMPDCLEMPYKPAVSSEIEKREGIKETILGGNSCLSGDFIRDFYFEKSLEIGQEIIFEDMVHYTMVKTTTFNGVKHPSIGILHENDAFELLRSFHQADYITRNS